MKKLSNFLQNFSQEYLIDDTKDLSPNADLLSYHDPRCFIAQQYNQIAGTLLHDPKLRKHQSFIITSPQPGDGKSTTLANVAISLASKYNQKVLIIDADWRRPSQNLLFDTETLKQAISLEIEGDLAGNLLQTQIDNLCLLPVDTDKHEEWLDIIKENLSEFKAEFDIILIDTAPILKVVDAAILGQDADALIMIIRAQDTPEKLILDAEEILKNNYTPTAAAILVNAPTSVDVYNYLLNPHYRRYYSNYYYEYGNDPNK